MSYRDKKGEYITFERKVGEDPVDPEHATITCPHCKKVATCKSTTRSIYSIAHRLNWVVLPTANVIYCSRRCSYLHAPEEYQKHIDLLSKQKYELLLSLRKWHFKE